MGLLWEVGCSLLSQKELVRPTSVLVQPVRDKSYAVCDVQEKRRLQTSVLYVNRRELPSSFDCGKRGRNKK